jgi:hypothetical protein
VPVNGEPFAGELVSIDADGALTFRSATGEPASAVGVRTLAANDLVRWSHPARVQPQTLVVLSDGSRLVTAADWSGGAAVRIEGDAIVVRSDTWNEARLARSQVCGFVFAERSHPQDRQRLEDDVRSAGGKQDQVLLTNQDRLTGTVKQLAGGTLTLATDAGDAELPLSRVEAVFLEPSPHPSPKAREISSGMIVGLRDGSLLYAKSVQADEASLKLQTAGGVKLSGGTCDDIAVVQSLGADFVYLSDLEPADYRHVPYLDIAWPYQRDRNLQGEPLSVGGRLYLKGVAMHSAARLTYRLDGTYRRFDAEVALDDSAGGHPLGRVGGSVTFAVYLLRGGKWQEVFNSGVVRGGDTPRQVSVDLAGAAAMTLTVDFADRGDELDHADWLDARLVK